MIVLSVVMPVFNEQATVSDAIQRVLAVDYPCPVELIVVDDGSTDRTARVLRCLSDPRVTVLCHPVNRGKGAAVLTGVRRANGTHVLIVDADLEYSPNDIPSLLTPVMTGISDHVFGSRVFGLNTRFPSFRFAVGGRLTTVFANALFDSCLTDMHTCLKLVPLAHFRAMTLSEQRFGLDTELTASMLRAGMRPYEVPITYNGRGLDEGKKISWRDGWECLRILMVVRMRERTVLPVGPFDDRAGVVVAMPAPAIDHLADRMDEEMVDAVT